MSKRISIQVQKVTTEKYMEQIREWKEQGYDISIVKIVTKAIRDFVTSFDPATARKLDRKP